MCSLSQFYTRACTRTLFCLKKVFLREKWEIFVKRPYQECIHSKIMCFDSCAFERSIFSALCNVVTSNRTAFSASRNFGLSYRWQPFDQRSHTRRALCTRNKSIGCRTGCRSGLLRFRFRVSICNYMKWSAAWFINRYVIPAPESWHRGKHDTDDWVPESWGFIIDL